MITLARHVQVFHGQRFLVDPAWKERLGMVGIACDRDWARLVGEKLVSTSPSTKCYRMVLPDAEVIYFKRYTYPLRKILEFWLRPGKCAVEVWAYGRLQSLGIPTLDVVAFGERRILGMLTATFIVTREVPDSEELGKFVINTWCRMPEPERRRVYNEIAAQLIEQVRIAHRGGFFHHDLKWRNILVQKQDGRYATVWIDAPRASRMRFRERRGIMVDLSGLARIAVSLLSKYDRMRFVWRYLDGGRKAGDAKRLYQDVAQHLGRRPPKPLKLPPQDDRA
jgi:tRNA A-37 threonylcarbamoyl transferase component Bud32